MSGLQFRGKQPFSAADRYPEASEHAFPNTLRGADAKTAAHIDCDFRRPLAKGPDRATGALVLINDHLMRGEFIRSLRHAVRLEIRARTNDQCSALSHLAGGKS